MCNAPCEDGEGRGEGGGAFQRGRAGAKAGRGEMAWSSWVSLEHTARLGHGWEQRDKRLWGHRLRRGSEELPPSPTQGKPPLGAVEQWFSATAWAELVRNADSLLICFKSYGYVVTVTITWL